MKTRASKASSNFWKKSENADISLDELRNLANNNDGHLHDMIARYADMLRGTRSFWNSNRVRLEATLRMLTTPAPYFTMSGADLQWGDLYKHFPDRDQYLAVNDRERRAIANRLLQENPLIVAEYLDRRIQLFFKLVLWKKFTITDHWYRYEWRNRGSGHIHGFL